MKSMGDLLKRAIGQSEKLPPKYWTEGWNKFSFLMTPEQVKEVFEAYHLIIINSSVPIDYVESELSEYLSAYSETYKQLCRQQNNRLRRMGRRDRRSPLPSGGALR